MAPFGYMQPLKEAVEAVDLGKVVFHANLNSYYVPPKLECDGQFLDLYCDDLQQGLMVQGSHYRMDVEETEKLANLYESAFAIQAQFNVRVKQEAEEAARAREAERLEYQKRRAEEAEQRQKEYEEHQKLVKERSERVMTEFLGEKGRIRARGSKSYQTVICAAEERQGEDGMYYRGKFNWTHPHYDEGKQKEISQVMSFDIKVGSRYKVVWDDGVEDLGEWNGDQGDVRAKRSRLAKFDS